MLYGGRQFSTDALEMITDFDTISPTADEPA